MNNCQWAIPCQNPATSSNYCTTHNRALGIKIEKQKKVTPIKKVSDKQKERIKAAKPEKYKLSKFFAEMAAIMPKNCMECGFSLSPSLLIHARSTTCHILPKRYFKSISTEPDNIIFLCISCHGTFDNYSPERMKVFELAKQRVQSLLPKIKDEELKHIPDYYLK